MNFIKKIINFFENTPLNITSWACSFLGLMTIRILIENLIFNSLRDQKLISLVSFFVHTVFFFSFLYLVLLAVIKYFTKEKIKKIANILLWGYWIVLFPPILDALIFRGKDVWSFYYFGGLRELLMAFFTFFGDNLMVGVTLGSRIMIILAMIGLIFYVFIKTNNPKKTLLFSFFLYVIFFIFGSFPSWVTLLERMLSGKQLFTINSLDVASLFLTGNDFFGMVGQSAKISIVYKINLVYGFSIFLFLAAWQYFDNKEKFWSLVKNVRYPQMIFNGGLFLLGVSLGGFYYPQNFHLGFFEVLILIDLILVVFAAWFFSVFPNDINDLEVDKITNPDRPLVKKIFSIGEYQSYALAFFLFSLLMSAAINIKIFLLIICYHFLTFFYSSHPFRIKRFLGVASLLSSFASLLFLFSGFFLVSENQSLEKLPLEVVLLLLLVFVFLIPLKDLRDAKGDGKNGIFTLPVLLGIKNARLFLASAIFLAYFLSVYIINDKDLFLPALIFGSVSFWFISNSKIKVKYLNWWALFFVFLYGLTIIKIVFL
jgi:4-hydroxybenzoate polyprenyltransferase